MKDFKLEVNRIENKIDKGKIAGSLVLYNPRNKDLNNIKSYIDQIGKLFIHDNSEINNEDKINSFYGVYSSKIEYIYNGTNLGLPYCHNRAAYKSKREGYSFLLTLDQDSFFLNNYACMMLSIYSYLQQYNPNISYITPNQIWDPDKYSEISDIKYDTINNWIIENVVLPTASGTLFVLDNFIGFNEDYFIDYFDFEYSLRALKEGYKTFKVKNIYVKHEVAKSKIYKLFNKKIFVVLFHNKYRRYYTTRDSSFLTKEYILFYPKIVLLFINMVLIDPFKIILFEKEKREKFLYYFYGIKDFFHNKRGKLSR